jgi:hypothetical protein
MTRKISKLLVLSLAFIAAVACSNVAAQNTITGEWHGQITKDGSKINLNFERRSEDGRHTSNHGHTFEFSEVGLTKEQVQNGGAVTFRLAREAGTIDADGTFQNGKGSGTFRFTPNMAFLSAMKAVALISKRATPSGKMNGRLRIVCLRRPLSTSRPRWLMTCCRQILESLMSAISSRRRSLRSTRHTCAK